MSTTFPKASISTTGARALVAAAEAKAAAIGVPMCISICDESGNLKAFSRMDGAALLSVQIAHDKAWTSAAFSVPTDGLYEFIKNDPPLVTGLPAVARVIVFGGGYPIQVDGQVVGGIGVSGGHYNQDMEVAQAGLAALT